MTEDNVEIVRRGFTATMDADWQTALATLGREAEIHDYDIPDAGTYHGHDGWFAWLENWSESWDSWRVEDVEFRAVEPDGAIALFRMIAKGGTSGLEVERRDAIVYRLENGKIVRMEYFNDQAKALQAAGLVQ
jgi:ketosteroid isomerase-like protein